MEKRSNTIQHVAERAGVSIATVSRVLNETDYPVRPETRRRVLEAIEALDFRPSPLARGLLGKSTQTIGLMIPDISNPYYPLLARGVEDVANEHDYTLIFCNTDRSAAKLRHYLEVMREKQVDGIIFAGGGLEEDGEDVPPREFAGKVVLVGKHAWPFPSVQVDNIGAAFAATSHLLQLGHERVALIGGPNRLTSVRDRLRGYRQALMAEGIQPTDDLVREGDFGHESGYQAALGLMSLPNRPTAIFAANDRMAIGAMAAIIDTGMRVPEDVAVVGFDDTPAAKYVRPALTTVALPSYDIGSSAAQMLLKLLAGDPIDETVCLPTRLEVRQSSGNGGRSQ